MVRSDTRERTVEKERTFYDVKTEVLIEVLRYVNDAVNVPLHYIPLFSQKTKAPANCISNTMTGIVLFNKLCSRPLLLFLFKDSTSKWKK